MLNNLFKKGILSKFIYVTLPSTPYFAPGTQAEFFNVLKAHKRHFLSVS